MGVSRRQRATFLLRLALLAGAGLAAVAYLFVMQRGPVPLRDTYRIKAAFTAADGVVGGLGQPVNVAGVKVGAIVGTYINNAGDTVVEMEIDRSELRSVHADARATLEPITPLKDMQVELSPGSDSSPVLPSGRTIAVSETTPPTELASLLSALDGDTRAYFQSLLRSLQIGTKARAINMRLLFSALGPTTRQAREVASAVADRRARMARLVTNLAKVTRAAGRDDQLASVISAGNATLAAIGGQDGALGHALDEFPATLGVARSTLTHAAQFSQKLTPALTAITPAVRALPATFRAVTPFAEVTGHALATQIRPFVREARPLVGDLGPATSGLSKMAQPLTTVVRTTNYVLNELAYNPPSPTDEGNLFWLGYFFHNFGSAFSLGDAHGTIGSAMAFMSCPQLTASAPGALVALLTGAANACPGTG